MTDRCPAFADPDAASRPLHVVPQDALEAWRQALPVHQAAFLADCGFTAGAGDVALLPDTAGRVVAAVVGHGTAASRARGRFLLSRAVSSLPAGDWHFEGLPEANATEAALGWLLAQYRFDRYRKPSPPLPGLKCPETVDAELVLAMAEGEWLTRDLINTPAADLGPAELQAALLERAQRWVKPGGSLVYATCSLERAEGEDQAARVTLTPDPIRADELPAGLAPTDNGWLRTDPSQLAEAAGLDGFFIARWRV